MTNPLDDLDQNFDKEWSRKIKEEFAKAKQGIGETNKEFAELMKLLNQSTTKQNIFDLFIFSFCVA